MPSARPYTLREAPFWQAALWLVLSELFFASMGASVKSLAGSLPNEMAVFLRNLIGALILLPWLLRRGSPGLKTEVFGLHMLRSLAGLAAMYCFFYALTHIELAQAVVLKMTTPLFIPVIAWLWLAESLPWQVRVAVLVGFAGVACIVRPEFSGADWAMLIALAGGFFAGLAKVTVRRLSASEPGTRTIMYFAIVGTLVAFLPALRVWVWPDSTQWAWMLAVAGFGTLGQFTMTRAYSLAPAARVGPFSYASVIFATTYGYLFWGEAVDLLDAFGALLIFVAAVLVFRNSSRRYAAMTALERT